MNEPPAQFLAARGGAGGRGNTYFLSSENTTPRIAESGGNGEKITYELELKLLADAGLVCMYRVSHGFIWL